MECFVTLLIFGFVAILVSGAGVGLGPSRSSRALQALPRRFGGTYHGGRVFRRPSVRFRYGPTWVTVTRGPKRGQNPTTQVSMVWLDPTTNLLVDTRSTYLRTVLGSTSRDIRLGDDDFDRRFHVAGHPEHAVRRLLSEGVRWQINKLCQFMDCPFISLTIRQGKLTIVKPMLFRRGDELEQFTQFCLELFDQAMLTRSEGIEFMSAADEAQLIDDPTCQICGEAIVTDMVFCQRCRTPHHLECWHYAGNCSTYGCRETRYAVPTIARPVNTDESLN